MGREIQTIDFAVEVQLLEINRRLKTWPAEQLSWLDRDIVTPHTETLREHYGLRDQVAPWQAW